jgi:hypothetical protein
MANTGAVLPMVQYIVSVESNETAIAHHHAQYGFDKGGLAAAIGADEGNTFPLAAGDRYIIEGSEFAKLLAYITGYDHNGNGFING